MTMPLPAVNRRRATGLNLMFQYAAVSLTVVQGFVLVPFYLKYIETGTYGAWLATGNVVAWLAIIDPGFTAVLQQRVARLLGRGERTKLAQTIGTGVSLGFGVAVLFIAIGVTSSPLVPGLIALDGGVASVISRAFAIACIAEAVLQLDLAIASVLMGLMTRIVWTGTIYLGCTLSGILTTLLLLHQGVGVLCIPLGLLVRSVSMLCCHGFLLWRVLRWELCISPAFSVLEFRSVLGPSIFTWTARMATSVVGNMDAFLVARFFGPAAVTGYVLTKRASEVLGMVVSRAGAGLMPALSHAWGAGGGVAVIGVASRLLRLSVWSSLLGAAAYVGLNREFVALWVGPQMFGGVVISALFGLSSAALAFESIATAVLFSADGMKASSSATALSALGRVALTVVLLSLGAGEWSIPLCAAGVSIAISSGVTLRYLSRAVGADSGHWRANLLGRIAEGLPLVALGLAWSLLLAPTGSLGWRSFTINAAALGTSLLLLLLLLSAGFRSECKALSQGLAGRLKG